MFVFWNFGLTLTHDAVHSVCRCAHRCFSLLGWSSTRRGPSGWDYEWHRCHQERGLEAGTTNGIGVIKKAVVPAVIEIRRIRSVRPISFQLPVLMLTQEDAGDSSHGCATFTTRLSSDTHAHSEKISSQSYSVRRRSLAGPCYGEHVTRRQVTTLFFFCEPYYIKYSTETGAM